MVLTVDDGTRLHAIGETSSGVPLVLSNSLGTDLSLWDAQLNAFSDRSSVWRYDTRGHGQSDAPADEYSLDRLGRDLLAIVDATGAPRVDLCGVSIGGLTALWVAIHARERVHRLILANTAARIGNVDLWTERMRTARAAGLRPLADAAMDRWFTEDFRQREPARVSRFRAAFERTNVDGYIGCCAALRDADLRPLLRRVVCPTLVITGRHDPATPPADGQWLAGEIPAAQLVALNAAHLSNVERSEDFNAAMRDFLSAGGRDG